MCERTPLAEVLLLPGNGARKLLLAVGVGDAVEMLALIPDNGAVELVGEGVRCGQRGTCTQHKRYFAPTKQ